MAKDPHRIFEIYESRDEAAWELMPKGNTAKPEAAAPQTWSFKQIAVSQLAGITQVQFREATLLAQDIITRIEDEFGELADKLSGNSRVLVDFTGVETFSPNGINALNQLNRKLRVRGSRMVLCCLEPSVRAIFFAE